MNELSIKINEFIVAVTSLSILIFASASTGFYFFMQSGSVMASLITSVLTFVSLVNIPYWIKEAKDLRSKLKGGKANGRTNKNSKLVGS